MSISEKQLKDIVPEDIHGFIANGIDEDRSLEYKQNQPAHPSAQADSTEFCRDVSAMANAGGGNIIYGIATDKTTGKPSSIRTFAITNWDKERLRLQDILMAGVSPRIPGIDFEPIAITPDQFVIVTRVPSSHLAPHMVTRDHENKFYRRHGTSRLAMDYHEVRDSMLAHNWLDAARNWRDGRFTRLERGSSTIMGGPRLVVHIIPADFLKATTSSLDIAKSVGRIRPFAVGGTNVRFIGDGYQVFYIRAQCSQPTSYVTLFRSGCVEAAGSDQLFHRIQGSNQICPSILEDEFLGGLEQYIGWASSVPLRLPILISGRMQKAAGYCLGYKTSLDPAEHVVLDDDIQLPELIIESWSDYDQNPRLFLKPLVDTIWNAFNWPESPHFSTGRWAQLQDYER